MVSGDAVMLGVAEADLVGEPLAVRVSEMLADLLGAGDTEAVRELLSDVVGVSLFEAEKLCELLEVRETDAL